MASARSSAGRHAGGRNRRPAWCGHVPENGGRSGVVCELWWSGPHHRARDPQINSSIDKLENIGVPPAVRAKT